MVGKAQTYQANESDGLIDIEVSGIDHDDCPDYCDAFIESARWADSGKELTEEELEEVNKDREFVYQKLIDYLH